MTRGALVACALSIVACQNEKVGTAVGPPLLIASPDAAAPITPPDAAPAAAAPDAGGAFCPAQASFFDVTKDPRRIEHVACETRATVVVRGKVRAASFVPQDKPMDESLVAGDVMLTQGQGRYDLVGDGVVLFAILQPPACDPPLAQGVTKKVIRGKDVPEIRLPSGLAVHLDVEGANATVAYLGRLEGAAAVPEHVHDGSWEVICAVEAAGTLTIAGAPARLGPRTCLQVPPKTKHAWQPDPGSKLVAVQIYTPPGPEQRFKAAQGGGVPAPKR